MSLGGCQSDSSAPGSSAGRAHVDGPPSQPRPDLAHLPDPVPRKEPKSARGNPATYTVFGKTYRVMDSSAGYYATGVASWYGKDYHGRQTASGSVYNMYEMTAAHKTLGFGTRVRVTHARTGRSIVVEITDRGPFVKGRVIDLSYGAARKLGMVNEGIAQVHLDIVK